MEKSSSAFERPVALVTGASSGIGAAFARALSEAGYALVLCGRNEVKLRAVQMETGGDVLLADLATDAGLLTVERRISQEERCDFLVNNAGFGTTGKFWEGDPAGQDAMHRVHVMATLRLSAAALPRMVRRNHGSIINVSSVAAFMPAIGSISYSATKVWMNSFSEGLWLELKGAGSSVHVQALCPGFTHTDFHQTLAMDVSRIPQSLWSSPEEVVRASLNGLARNEPLVIPGWRYRAWVKMQRFLPRAVLHAIAAKSAEKFRPGSATEDR